jgi:hypothetical protein
MENRQFRTDITAELAEAIVRTARTSVSDTLRTVVYFSPSQFDVLYTRQDLYESPETTREAKAELVEFERMGFAEAPVRSVSSEGRHPTIGPYEFTVRFHRDGFVVRAIEGDHGVLLTTDSMEVDAFEEAVSAFKRLLAEA